MRDPLPIYHGRFIDRSPCIRSAGKLFPRGERAESCLVEIDHELHAPPVVQKFLNTRRPNPGARTLFYGKANDPSVHDSMTHGISTRPTLSAGSLINLPPKTSFQQKLIEKSESIYSSNKQAPLGKTHDQIKALPAAVDLDAVTFGRRSIRGISASSLINPPKSLQEVEEESQKGHELYLMTHNDYNTGEVRDRKYDLTTFKKDQRFGKRTPHSNNGKNVARSLLWLPTIKLEERGKVVFKRVDDFRERTQHQIGKVLNPIADTMNVPPGHTFGILHHGNYGVGDVIQHKTSKNVLNGSDRHRTILAAVQQHLKTTNSHNLGWILTAFAQYDKNGDGKIHKEDLKRICVQFGLEMDPDLLDSLIEHCEVHKDGMVDVNEFADLLNRNNRTNLGKIGTKTLTQFYRTYGIPTVRTDIAPPRIRRISDRNNYGDESNAYGLLSPSIFTQNMVFEKDFLKSRPKEEISQILHNTGITISPETFEQLWERASKSHPKGEVSVESIRGALDEMEAPKFAVKAF
ncbi:EF-hand domain-containing family member B [Rhinophrynus dorsalis]